MKLMTQEGEDILNAVGAQLTPEEWLMARFVKATPSCPRSPASASDHRVVFTF